MNRDGGLSAKPSDVVVIEPPGRWALPQWPELWRYRELLYFLAWRDVKIRYKQTALGVAWALLQPLLTMIVFTLLFGRLAGFAAHTGGVPYPIYVFSGLLPWTFFANAITASSASVVAGANLVGKVFFPRLLMPLSSIAAAVVDLLLSLLMLGALLLYYRIPFHLQIGLVVPLALGTALLSAGVGTFLAALNVAYRDVRYVVPFGIQLLMFLSGVMYPPAIIPERWREAYFLNPLASLIEGFRAALLGTPVPWGPLAFATLTIAAIFLAGTAYFASSERRFADII